MAFRARRQRHGRVFYWVCGLLLLAFFGVMGYQRWRNRARQDQDNDALDRLKNARLVTLRIAEGDPNDWPRWRGVHNDATAPGEKLLTAWPEDGLEPAWRQKIKVGAGFSAVAVVGKRLVTMFQDGENEAVVCWEDQGDRAKELWRFAYKSHFSQDGEGPRATPTIAGDHVYTIGPRGHVFCLTLKDGKEVWKKNLLEDFDASLPRWGYSSSPLVEGDALLLNPGGEDNAVVALDRMTGSVRWKALSGHPGYSSPVLSNGGGVRQVLFFLGGELVGLNPESGAVYWRFHWKTEHDVNAATPLVLKDETSDDNYVFLSSGYGKGCALVRVFKGEDGKPAVQRVYENNLMKNHFGSSVFLDDHIYGFDEGYLTCMKVSNDSREGLKPLWTEKGFNKGTLIVAGKQLIVLGEKGFLALVEPSPEKFIKLAEFSLKRGRYWTMPVVAHGRLYVRNEDTIECFNLKAK